MTYYCGVCRSLDREEIEAKVREGVSLGDLSRHYDLHKSVISRHMNHHVNQPEPEPVPEQQLPVATEAIGQEQETVQQQQPFQWRHYLEYDPNFIDQMRRALEAMEWPSLFINGQLVGGNEEKCRNFLQWLQVDPSLGRRRSVEMVIKPAYEEYFQQHAIATVTATATAETA